MDKCPGCNSSWVGDEIPKDIQQYYSGTHWKREIGIDGGYIGVYDGTVALRCPDCNEEFPVNSTKWRHELFEKYKKVLSGSV